MKQYDLSRLGLYLTTVFTRRIKNYEHKAANVLREYSPAAMKMVNGYRFFADTSAVRHSQHYIPVRVAITNEDYKKLDMYHKLITEIDQDRKKVKWYLAKISRCSSINQVLGCLPSAYHCYIPVKPEDYELDSCYRDMAAYELLEQLLLQEKLEAE